MATLTQGMKEFHLFSHLQDELQINVLSYIADAPFEEKCNGASSSSPVIITTEATNTTSTPASLSRHCMTYSSTLTHVLPYVSKKFCQVHTKSDQLWKDALMRQLVCNSDPELWYSALQNIVHRTTNRTYSNITKSNHTNGDDKEDKPEALHRLIDQAYQVLASVDTPQFMNYRYLYRIIMNSQLRQILPVFTMTGDVVLNEPYGLHLFEYRYRYMMQNLMRQHANFVRQAYCNDPHTTPTTSATRTQLLQQYPIYFLHANRGNIRRSEMAVIAQVIQCDLHPDGRADIVVKPIHFCWIERSWLYTAHSDLEHGPRTGQASILPPPPPHNLYYAQVLKMGRTATNAMHYLQRQETLTNVMERLIASGVIVQDEAGIHRANVNVRPVHVNFFELNTDDDDDENGDGEFDDDDGIEGEEQFS